MLVDGRDAILTPERLVKRLQQPEVAQSLRRSRIRPGIVARVFINQQTAVRMRCLFERWFDSVCETGDIVVIARNKQRWNANRAQALRVPCPVRRLLTPGRNRNYGLYTAAVDRLKFRTHGTPILQ